MFEADHLQYNITSGYIQIVSGEQYLPAFWAHPELGGPFPGLVMLHDDWGLTPHLRSEARRFAEQGYYVIAPDVFNRQVAASPAEAQALAAQSSAAALAHIAAAFNVLKAHHKCNSTMGLIGWGMGGALALRMALDRRDLSALVMFYTLPHNFTPAQLKKLDCPLLAILAEMDPSHTPEQIEWFHQALEGMKDEHEVVVYPAVGRDFFDDTRPAFDPTAAASAWKRALEFFNKHLDVPPITPGMFDPGKVY